MGDLTIRDYKHLSEEELSRALLDEKRKMFGSDLREDCLRDGPLTLYSESHSKPKD